jgi:WD40 repeat protein/serine/threonine protein kinase
MNSQTRIDELVRAWQEAISRGETPSVDDLCHDCPEMRDDLKRALGDPGDQTPPTRSTPGGEQAQTVALSGTFSSPDGLRAGTEPVPGYLLERLLGRGGFGEVWQASAPGGFRVAFKFVSLAGRGAELELRALEVIRGLRHPNLLTIFGVWQTDDWLIIGMELADRTLHDLLQESARRGTPGLEYRPLVRYSLEAARVIDYLNKPRHFLGGDRPVGIQHGDIKPQNILLLGEGVKVGDFGLVRVLEKALDRHSGGMTPHYAAPEVIEGRISRWSDQYSLAVTWCQLRGGRLPFTGTTAEVVQAHCFREPDLTMLPAAERPVVARALSKNPRQRWPNCRAFLRALAESSRSAPRVSRSLPPMAAAGPPLPAARRTESLGPTAPDQEPPPAARPWHAPSRPPANSSRKRLRPLAGLVLAAAGVLFALYYGLGKLGLDIPDEGAGRPFPQSRVRAPDRVRVPPDADGRLIARLFPGWDIRKLPPGIPQTARIFTAPVAGPLQTATALQLRDDVVVEQRLWEVFASPRAAREQSIQWAGIVGAGAAGPLHPCPPTVFFFQETFPLKLLIRSRSAKSRPSVPDSAPVLLTRIVAAHAQGPLPTLPYLHELSVRFPELIPPAPATPTPPPTPTPPDVEPNPPSPPDSKPVRAWPDLDWVLIPGGLLVVLLLLLQLPRFVRRWRQRIRQPGAARIPAPPPANTGRVTSVSPVPPPALEPPASPPEEEAHADAVWVVAVSADGRLGVSGGLDGELYLWEIGAELRHRHLGSHEAAITAVAVTPDSRSVLSVGLDNLLCLWAIDPAREVQRWTLPDGRFIATALSADARFLLLGGADGSVRLWDIAGECETTHLAGHSGAITAVAFSPDGRLVLTAGEDRIIRIQEVAGGREVLRVDGETTARAVQFSPDGRVIGSGDEDGHVRLWEVDGGRELPRPEGHGDWVRAVVFSLDGSRVLSTGDDETLCVWDAGTGLLLLRLGSVSGSVLSLAFLPDGRHVLVGAEDGSVRLLDVSPEAAGVNG